MVASGRDGALGRWQQRKFPWVLQGNSQSLQRMVHVRQRLAEFMLRCAMWNNRSSHIVGQTVVSISCSCHTHPSGRSKMMTTAWSTTTARQICMFRPSTSARSKRCRCVPCTRFVVGPLKGFGFRWRHRPFIPNCKGDSFYLVSTFCKHPTRHTDEKCDDCHVVWLAERRRR